MRVRPLTARLAAALFVTALPAAAIAAGDPPSGHQGHGEAGAQAKQPAAEERKICRRIEASGARTGAQRVCMTRAEWRALERQQGY